MSLVPAAPGWRSPVLWLVVGLPILCLAAIAATVFLAVPREDSTGARSVQRIAQIQIENLAPDVVAAQERWRAQLAVHPHEDAVTVHLEGNAPSPERLQLVFAHPTDARLDHAILLTAVGGAWHGRTRLQTGQAWDVELRGDGRFRLVGRLPREAHEALLAPAVKQ